MELARQLLRERRERLPDENSSDEIRRQSIPEITQFIELQLFHRLQSSLQAVIFTDVTSVDEGVHVLLEWKEVLGVAMDEILQVAHTRLAPIPRLQYKVYTEIQKIIIVLLKVLKKCLFRLGQISLPPANVISPNFNNMD